MVIPHYLGMNKIIEDDSKDEEDDSDGLKRQDSFSSRSSLQDIPLLLPQEAEPVDNSPRGPKSNGSDTATSKSVSFRQQKAKIDPVETDMQMKGFVDDRDSPDSKKMSMDRTQPGTKTSDGEWWETQERGDQVGFADDSGQVGPRTPCQCQVRGIAY